MKFKVNEADIAAALAAMPDAEKKERLYKQTHFFVAVNTALAGATLGLAMSTLAETLARVMWEFDVTDWNDAIEKFEESVWAFLDLQEEIKRREIQ